MTVDELINKAKDGGGGYLNPANLFALVGAPDTNEIFVLGLEDFFIDNFRHFLKGEESGLIFLGAYNDEQSARNSIDSLRETDMISPAGLISGFDWYVLIADTTQNHLFTLPLMEYYKGYVGLFKFRAKGILDNVVINIFDSESAAMETIEVIRMYIKDEKGNLQ